MKIGGLHKVSLIDYPAKISAVVFTQGCNFRCSYCHNPELVDSRLFQPCLPENDILDFLSTRVGKLEGVTITGGEPTLQENLVPFIRRIRKLGFNVKLDTNGSHPDLLAEMIGEKLLDFVAMDIKAPLEKYSSVVHVPVKTDDIRRSIQRVIKSRVPHEFRTTVVASQLEPKDFLVISQEIKGAKRYVLQKYQPVKSLAGKFLRDRTYSDDELISIAKKLEKNIPLIIVR
jgi:pyruvate formate lyase activating enzyme